MAEQRRTINATQTVEADGAVTVTVELPPDVALRVTATAVALGADSIAAWFTMLADQATRAAEAGARAIADAAAQETKH